MEEMSIPWEEKRREERRGMGMVRKEEKGYKV
jgi:hypothetical protein